MPCALPESPPPPLPACHLPAGPAEKAVPEFATFGCTLARRMAALLASGGVEVGGALWTLAVDQILVKLVDSETQVRQRGDLGLRGGCP